MLGFTPLSLAFTLTASAVISLVILWGLGRAGRPARVAPDETGSVAARTARFLFQDETLVDQDTETGPVPGLASGEIKTWRDLRQWLGPRFGPLPRSLTDLNDGETRAFPADSKEDLASLAVSRKRGTVRVEVLDPAAPDPLEQHRARCLNDAIARYQTMLDRAPCAMRVLDANGQTIWQNSGFRICTEDVAQTLIEAASTSDTPHRVHIPSARIGQDRFFEVDHIDLGKERVVYATDVTQVAQAEMVRREFIQTLTKTFANLTTGLAVFDRHRQLALFNPALLDLTGLPAPFLSAQPPLMQFFDRLRDNRVLPEPKNYKDWQKQIDEMISTASDGLYLEDWDLPNGTTYRVTGRPHPDGAVAFLFEDITDNVALARRFRSQISLREAVLDASDQAKIVFGPDNIVTLCNLTCRALLGIDPDASFADMTLRDILIVCKKRFRGGKFWNNVEKAVTERADWDDLLLHGQGTAYLCRVRSLPGNSSIITLRAHHDVPGLVAPTEA